MGQLRRGPHTRQDEVLQPPPRPPPTPAPLLLSGKNTNRQEHLQSQVSRLYCIKFRVKQRWAATCKYHHAICHFKISDTIETSSRDGDPFKILLSVSLWVSYQGHFMTRNRNTVFDATVKFLGATSICLIRFHNSNWRTNTVVGF